MKRKNKLGTKPLPDMARSGRTGREGENAVGVPGKTTIRGSRGKGTERGKPTIKNRFSRRQKKTEQAVAPLNRGKIGDLEQPGPEDHREGNKRTLKETGSRN